MFAVRVYGIAPESEELVPFLVLGTSALALLSAIFILFVTSKYFHHDDDDEDGDD